MLPVVYGENMFDDLFDNGFFGSHNPLFGKNARNLMKTDIRETDDAKAYRLAVELPGCEDKGTFVLQKRKTIPGRVMGLASARGFGNTGTRSASQRALSAGTFSKSKVATSILDANSDNAALSV